MFRDILVKFNLLALYSPYREKKKTKTNTFTYGDLQILRNAYVLQLIHFSVKSRNQPTTDKFSTDQRISVITAMATIYIT